MNSMNPINPMNSMNPINPINHNKLNTKYNATQRYDD